MEALRGRPLLVAAVAREAGRAEFRRTRAAFAAEQLQRSGRVEPGPGFAEAVASAGAEPPGLVRDRAVQCVRRILMMCLLCT